MDVSTLDPAVTAKMSKPSKMAGVPVRDRKLPPDSAWKDGGKCGVFESPAVRLLFRVMDPRRDDFGWASRQWDYPVGSVLLARADGKYMTPR